MIAPSPVLLGRGGSRLRDAALSIAEAGLAAADPMPRVLATVSLDGPRLTVGEASFDVSRGDVVVAGAGKASARVAAGLEDVLGDRIARGLVVAREGQVAALERVELAFAQRRPHTLGAGRAHRSNSRLSSASASR